MNKGKNLDIDSSPLKNSSLEKALAVKEENKFSKDLLKEVSDIFLQDDKKELLNNIENRVTFKEYEEVCSLENELGKFNHFLKIKDTVVEAFHLEDNNGFLDEKGDNNKDLKDILDEKFTGMVSSDFIGGNRFLDIFNNQKNKDNESAEESSESEVEKYKKELDRKKRRKRKKTKQEAMDEIRENDELGEDFQKLKKRLGMIGEAGSGYLPIKMDKKKKSGRYIFSSLKSKR